MKQTTAVDLARLAREAMCNNGFIPDFDKSIEDQVQQIKQRTITAGDGIKDLRGLLWSSIDNVESRDLDQIEYAEKLDGGYYRLVVGIADVDCDVAKDSPVDKRAATNTTSVYTGIIIYPMLPEDLSCGLTSLAEFQDRLAMIIDMKLSSKGSVESADVYRALVNNKAQLNYPEVGQWIEHGVAFPKLDSVAGLKQQLEIQNEIAQAVEQLSIANGALNFHTIEANPVTANGKVVDIAVDEQNAAKDLIMYLMVSANTAVAEFLEQRNIALIKRVVKTPERWDRIVAVAREHKWKLPADPDSKALADFIVAARKQDPDRFPDLCLSIIKLLGPGQYIVQRPGEKTEGHFGLALHDYTHSTAPNRRFVDLTNQRLLKSHLAGKQVPYAPDDLDSVAEHCMTMETASRKVERFVRKAATAVVLSTHIGEVFDGIITGRKPDATYVRIKTPHAEGMIVHGGHGLDVGDKVKVKLVSVDPEKGYIDFERA
jgi:exoribonuclease-2